MLSESMNGLSCHSPYTHDIRNMNLRQSREHNHEPKKHCTLSSLVPSNSEEWHRESQMEKYPICTMGSPHRWEVEKYKFPPFLKEKEIIFFPPILRIFPWRRKQCSNLVAYPGMEALALGEIKKCLLDGSNQWIIRSQI